MAYSLFLFFKLICLRNPTLSFVISFILRQISEIFVVWVSIAVTVKIVIIFTFVLYLSLALVSGTVVGSLRLASAFIVGVYIFECLKSGFWEVGRILAFFLRFEFILDVGYPWLDLSDIVLSRFAKLAYLFLSLWPLLIYQGFFRSVFLECLHTHSSQSFSQQFAGSVHLLLALYAHMLLVLPASLVKLLSTFEFRLRDY